MLLSFLNLLWNLTLMHFWQLQPAIGFVVSCLSALFITVCRSSKSEGVKLSVLLVISQNPCSDHKNGVKSVETVPGELLFVFSIPWTAYMFSMWRLQITDLQPKQLTRQMNRKYHRFCLQWLTQRNWKGEHMVREYGMLWWNGIFAVPFWWKVAIKTPQPSLLKCWQKTMHHPGQCVTS